MVYPGAEGLKIMQDMMVRVRERNLSEIAGVKVKTIRDIQESTEYSPLEPSKKLMLLYLKAMFFNIIWKTAQ